MLFNKRGFLTCLAVLFTCSSSVLPDTASAESELKSGVYSGEVSYFLSKYKRNARVELTKSGENYILDLKGTRISRQQPRNVTMVLAPGERLYSDSSSLPLSYSGAADTSFIYGSLGVECAATPRAQVYHISRSSIFLHLIFDLSEGGGTGCADSVDFYEKFVYSGVLQIK